MGGMWKGTLLVTMLVGFGGISCGTPPEPIALPLIDMFDAATVEGTVEIEPIARTEWRFDGEGTVELPQDPDDADDGDDGDDAHATDDTDDLVDTFGWEAFNDVDGLMVRDGQLVGRAGELAVLHARRPDALDENDLLHSVEISMRVTEGTQVGVSFNRASELDHDNVLRGMRRATQPPMFAELEPGDDLQTYTLQNIGRSFPIATVRHIFIYPTDADGAEFEIESVRLVPRKEHLRSIPSGPGWQGLDEIYRETIVSRSPERITLDLDLPAQPWLELSVGTIEDSPVTFRVDVGLTSVWRRTVTLPRRWETKRIDLGQFAGQRVALSLTLEGDNDGTVGFWGTPVVRHSGVLPERDEATETPARRALADGGSRTAQGVIVFLSDTLRSDHLEMYGYGRETAPFLSQLAAEGVRFDDTISQATWTKVSVPTLLSSIYPPAHGIVSPPDRLSSRATTLAEAFREAGYATFQTASVPFTGRLSNLHQGVEVLHERASIDNDDLGHSFAKTARTYVDRFLTWLDDHHDVPFYAFIHTFDPHWDYEPYPPYDLVWASPSGKEDHEARIEQVREHFGDDLRAGDGNRFGAGNFPTVAELEEADVDADAYNAHLLDWYDGSIRGMDAELSRLLEGLRERGVADDTLLAFVSDHGEEFFDHGWGWHGNTVYGEAVNVPMMLWWPGVVPSGVVVDETVESISLMPTLLELSGVSVPEGAQGQSLLPLMAGNDDPASLGWERRPAYSERKRMESTEERSAYDVDQYSVVLDGWKLVRNIDPPEGQSEYELYNHVEDRINHHDVAADHPEIVERLTAQLAERLRYLEARKLPTDEEGTESGGTAAASKSRVSQITSSRS